MLIAVALGDKETEMLKRLIRFELLVALLMAVAVGGVAFMGGRAFQDTRD